MIITKGARVVLTAEARADRWKSRYIGTRLGSVLRIDGAWPVIAWDGVDAESRIRPGDVELAP